MQEIFTKNTYDQLAQQAKIQVWASLIAFVSMITTLIATRSYYTGYLGIAIVFTCLTVFFLGLNVYNANCLVKGNCNVYSWVIVGMTLFITLIEFCLILYTLAAGGKLSSFDSRDARFVHEAVYKQKLQKTSGDPTKIKEVLQEYYA
jgi:ATP/ADP translocase